ncbi:hypothetical protein JT359_18800 [Candidatus Poribacteria bacterium]|nr:hypothetical protein [Candidatus Poribacteria bacterium]
MNIKIYKFIKGKWGRLKENITKQRQSSDEQNDRLMIDLKNIHGSYGELIQDIQTDIQCYKQAIGKSISLIEQKNNQLRYTKSDISNLERELITADLILENTTNLLRNTGKTEVEFAQDTEYLRCYDTHRGIRSSLEKKKVRIGQLAEEIKHEQKTLEAYKLRIVVLRDDLDKIEIKNEVVADLIVVHGKADCAETLSQISMVDMTTE